MQTKEVKPPFGIKSWSEDDRPREKLVSKGRSVLSDAELIAILIGSGSKKETAVELSRRILNHVGNNLNELGKLTVSDLIKFKGIGEAKAVSIVAALELGRRRKEVEVSRKNKIQTSKDAFDIIAPSLADLPHEEFWAIYLNRANNIVEKRFVSSGGVAGTVVDVKMVIKPAVENLASSIILCHNHPSGNKQPSDADIKITKKIIEAGKLLEINILDHIIICENSYFSFADEGML